MTLVHLAQVQFQRREKSRGKDACTCTLIFVSLLRTHVTYRSGQNLCNQAWFRRGQHFNWTVVEVIFFWQKSFNLNNLLFYFGLKLNYFFPQNSNKNILNLAQIVFVLNGMILIILNFKGTFFLNWLKIFVLLETKFSRKS